MNDDACVELASLDGCIGIRDSKNPEGGRLRLRHEPFTVLLEHVKRGELGF